MTDKKIILELEKFIYKIATEGLAYAAEHYPPDIGNNWLEGSEEDILISEVKKLKKLMSEIELSVSMVAKKYNLKTEF